MILFRYIKIVPKSRGGGGGGALAPKATPSLHQCYRTVIQYLVGILAFFPIRSPTVSVRGIYLLLHWVCVVCVR